MFSVFQQASTKRFNPRTREGATWPWAKKCTTSLVSIHAPVRVRLEALQAAGKKGCFNPRTREGATGSPASRRQEGLFQSTHP